MSASSAANASLTRRAVLGATAGAGLVGLSPVSAIAAEGPTARPVAARRRPSRPSAPRDARGPGRPAGATGAAAAESKERARGLPDPLTRHVLSRFTSGINETRLDEVDASGGVEAWFDWQLSPEDIPDHKADETWDWFPVLALPPIKKWKRYKRGTEMGWEMMQDLASWTMLRRLYTNRQVLELMTDFWADVLHVPSPADEAWLFRVEYQQMLRANALGSFKTLLKLAIPHPAMGLYLNNVESTATALNENLGREILECHTVGVGHYSQRDVVNSARILTGYHVDRRKTWKVSYVKSDHWTGHVQVMDFSSRNAHPDGRKVVEQYLEYLALHEATAGRLCRRLAVRFVSDRPSDELVAALAKVYLESDSEIVPVLRALVASDEFKASAMQKVRTPVEDALATWNALRVEVSQPHGPQDAGNQFINVSKAIGQVVYDWPAPNGFPDVAPAWIGAGRILGSMRTHWYASGGFWPTAGITFADVTSWLPDQLPIQLQDVVETVCAKLLFRPMTETMLDAACEAVDLDRHDTIKLDGPLVKYRMPRLLVSLLDTPEHLCR